MPRVGDSNACCILRVTYEFGYLASIIAGCWLAANLNIHRHSYVSTFREVGGMIMAVGRPLMQANFVVLVLDKLNTTYARPLSLF